MLELIPDQYKTQEMCNEAVEKNPWVLELVPDQFVTQKMGDEAVEKSPCACGIRGMNNAMLKKQRSKKS